MKYFLIIISSVIILSSCNEKGCVDPDATNFDVNATKDDGSCIYSTYEEDNEIDATDDPDIGSEDNDSLPDIIVDVQGALNNGKTCKEILAAGFQVSDLYGKNYQGGQIFYYDPSLNKGLVHSIMAFPSGDHVFTNGGTIGLGFSSSTNPDLSDNIFEGANNNQKILSHFSASSAAYKLFKWVSDLSLNMYDYTGFSDWYIPNKSEVETLFNNRDFDLLNSHSYNYVYQCFTSSLRPESTDPFDQGCSALGGGNYHLAGFFRSHGLNCVNWGVPNSSTSVAKDIVVIRTFNE